MLIKSKKLTKIQNPHKTTSLDVSEVAHAVQLEIHKAKQEARAIKQEAENILAESQKKLNEAEVRVKEIIKKANVEARELKEKVYNETLRLANEEADHLKSQARLLLKELFEVKREALNQAHKEIIKVALDLAGKIIKYQAAIDPNILKTQIVDSIKKATSEADRVQVFVNPADLKTLEQNIPEMEKLFPSGIDIVPLANDSVDPGSCLIETRSGQLDARFSTQLNALVSLVSHLEVKEPQIEIPEQITEVILPAEHENAVLIQEESDEELLSPIEQEKDAIIQDYELQVTQELKKDILTPDEEILKEELLSEKSLIDLLEEEGTFPFSDSHKENDTEVIKDPTPIQSTSQKENKKEEPEVPDESTAALSKRKKLFTENLSERTREETEELDELDYEFEDDEEELHKEEIKSSGILKPKKVKPITEISNIASELEKSPEWKDLVEEEDN